jgi:hypothetical protein
MHLSLASLLADITPQACATLIDAGVTHVTLVETRDGKWIALHAESASHAQTLARAWVDHHQARGASCRRLYADGIYHKPFATVYAQPEWEDA